METYNRMKYYISLPDWNKKPNNSLRLQVNPSRCLVAPTPPGFRNRSTRGGGKRTLQRSCPLIPPSSSVR